MRSLHKLIGSCLLALVTVAGIGAAEGAEFDKVLLPVAPRDAFRGAFGSLWQIEFSVLNRSDHGLLMYSWGPPCQILCEPDHGVREVMQGVTFHPDLREFVSSEVEGYFLWIERSAGDDFQFNLRVRDLSRAFSTRGTEIPVVTEDDVSSGTISLLDIPLNAGFRPHLRVYDYDGTGVGQVLVRFYAVDPDLTDPTVLSGDQLLLERVVPLHYAAEAANYPGYAAIPALGSIPELAGVSVVRIDVTPLETAVRIWASVSVTHNDTQHVTMITPQRINKPSAPAP